MRWLIVIVFLVLAGCAETVRCPDGQIFASDGTCVPITDAGALDAAVDAP